jgi:glycerol-3-phosphate dehydrogenase (NAD(P)+)
MRDTSTLDPIAVVGAGSWGTALAIAASMAGRETLLVARDESLVDDVSRHRRNARYLPAIDLPPGIQATTDLARCAGAGAVLLAAPAQHLRATAALLAPHLAPGTPVVICAKGIERSTGRLVNEIVGEEAPGTAVCVLSGPSFARDVALGMPTAVVVAGPIEVARRVQASLARPPFRPYATDDVIGVALGGAAKNVYAIACGLAAGYDLGESARAALLARSFSELLRLGAALGARSETLMGLAGLGDLALSATSRTSRNFDHGYRLASGERFESAAHPLAEGAATSGAILLRAATLDVSLPVADAVHAVLTDPARGEQVIAALLSRPVRDE